MGKTSGASEYARPDIQVQITEVGGQSEAEQGGPPDGAPARRSSPRRNPYFLAAWILTAGMTAAGIFLILVIRHQLLNPMPYADYAPSSSGAMNPAIGGFPGMGSALFLPTPEVSALASQLVVVGLAGATLLLIVQGVLHRVHHSPAARS